MLKYFSYNRRKLDELPYHYYHLSDKDVTNPPYIYDLSWIYDKVCGSNCFQLIEDIYMYKNVVKEKNFIELLVSFLKTHSNTLNYDGRQFYGCIYSYIHERVLRSEISVNTMDKKILETYRTAENPPVLSLVPISYYNINNDDSASSDTTNTIFKEVNFNLITRLPETDKFIVSISTKKEDISVWNVRT